MELWTFKSATQRIATTGDQTGSNLPSDEAPWKLVGSVQISTDDGPRVGASSLEILGDVARDGYSIWPRGD